MLCFYEYIYTVYRGYMPYPPQHRLRAIAALFQPIPADVRYTQTSMTLPPTPATLAPSGWRQPATQRASNPHGGRQSAGHSVQDVLPAAAAALRWLRAAAAHLEPVVFHAHAVLLRERLSEGGGRCAGKDGVLARLARRRARPAAAPPRRKSRGGALKRAGSG